MNRLLDAISAQYINGVKAAIENGNSLEKAGVLSDDLSEQTTKTSQGYLMRSNISPPYYTPLELALKVDNHIIISLLLDAGISLPHWSRFIYPSCYNISCKALRLLIEHPTNKLDCEGLSGATKYNSDTELNFAGLAQELGFTEIVQIMKDRGMEPIIIKTEKPKEEVKPAPEAIPEPVRDEVVCPNCKRSNNLWNKIVALFS